MGYHGTLNSSVSAGLGLVADWTLALSTGGELSAVLDGLVRQVGADAGLIVRIARPQGSLRHVARSETQAGKLWHVRARSHALTVLGSQVFTAQRGTLWMRSDSDRAGLPGAQEDIGPGGPAEVIVIVLERAETHVDVLELHFGTMPGPGTRDLLNMMGETLAKSWGRRAPGTVAKRLARKALHAVTDSGRPDDLPILTPENPAQLSRCEFRVCSLLREGMTVGVIAKTLSVGEATIRSHLSSVFAKTGTANQVELLHRLNRLGAPSAGSPERRLA